MKTSKWEKSKFAGAEIRAKTLGLVGLGRIGQEVAARAHAFEMKVIAHDPFISAEMAQTLGVELVWRDEDDDLKRRRMIRWDFKNMGYKHIQSRNRHQKILVEAMILFDSLLRPYLIDALQDL